MTSPAIKLAKECGIRIHKHSDDECHMISTNLLTRFYAKAQAQALRELVRDIVWPSKEAYDAAVPLILNRVAELERKA